MRQTELTLSNKDRRVLDECRSKGLRHAREVNRAHILAALDEKVPEALICQVLGVGRTAIWRTRAAYLEGGLDHALRDVQRPGRASEVRDRRRGGARRAGLLEAPDRGQAVDAGVAGARGTRPPRYARHQPRNDPSAAKKNCLKPWREMMWCVGVLTREYRQRMYELLDLYARPWNANEPVVCVDEKSKQLLHDSRPSLPMVPGTALRRDYEYVRSGTCNVFVAVEPLGGRRVTQVTDHRGKADFVAFAQHLIDTVYRVGQTHPSGRRQPQHPLPILLRRDPWRAGRKQASSQGGLPLHPEACKLAEHGGNRNRRARSPVPEPPHRRPKAPRS